MDWAVIRVLAFQHAAVLLVGCGGPGPESPHGEYRQRHGESDLGPGPAIEWSVEDMAPGPAGPQEDPVATTVRDLGLVDPDPGVRVATAAGDAGPLDREQFRAALLDLSPSVRMAAVESLAETSASERIARLTDLALALDDPEPAVRESVVECLADLNDPRAVALLLKARGDRSLLVREEAAEALRGLRAQDEIR